MKLSQLKEIKKIKKVNMYEIRCYPSKNEFSIGLGRKLRTYRKACDLVKRLKKSGIDAFKEKYEIIILS